VKVTRTEKTVLQEPGFLKCSRSIASVNRSSLNR